MAQTLPSQLIHKPMNEPDFGTQLNELFLTTPTPLSIADAAVQVGCSKQRGYAWLDRNRSHLIAVSRQYHGGTTYIDRANPNRPKTTSTAKGTAGGELAVGATLSVVSVGISGNLIVIDLMTHTGQVVRVTPITID